MSVWDESYTLICKVGKIAETVTRFRRKDGSIFDARMTDKTC